MQAFGQARPQPFRQPDQPDLYAADLEDRGIASRPDHHGHVVRCVTHSERLLVLLASQLDRGRNPHGRCQTVLMAGGESVIAVAERLGHEDAKLVLSTYGHLMPDSEDRTRKVVDAARSTPGDGGREGVSDGQGES
jgi:integrase